MSCRALWELGFRPFYLLASAFAALSVALWGAQYAGWLPEPYLRGPAWHGHEMLFGYTMAVVAGFLFTAVRNWTSRPTPTGGALAAIAALWLAGRVLVMTPYALAAAVVSAAFPLAVAVGIGIPLAASGNRRNYFLIVLLAASSAAALGVHLASLGWIDWPAHASLQAGLDVVLFMVSVIGGRVIPMFTNNGVPGAGARRVAGVERFALASVIALIAADVAQAPAAIVAVVAATAAMASAWRLVLWHPWKVFRAPLVWILHASYAWIPIHLGLRALGEAGLVSGPLATHALTIGVIGGMTLGMMTRTARGHTGRLLVAGRAEVAAYVLVQLAAVVRVFGPLIAPPAYVATVILAASLWSAAFAVYAVSYWPILTRPRVDARPG